MSAAKKITDFLDFTFGTVPFGSAGYATERIRRMRFTGMPVRALDRVCQWAGNHWHEGTIEARKAVAISKVASYVDMLRAVNLPITHKNLADAITTVGLTPMQALACVRVIEEKELVQFVAEADVDGTTRSRKCWERHERPDHEETVEEEAARLTGVDDA